jgi:hypothetical protein
VKNSGRSIAQQWRSRIEIDEFAVKASESSEFTGFSRLFIRFSSISFPENDCTAGFLREKIIHSFSG